jgi:tetratricopeptide (TPR) repeat protein
MATFLDGDVRGGVETFGRVADLFTDSGDLLRVVTPRSTRGHGLVFLGRSAEALADTDTALELARALGHPEGQAYALWHHAEALSAVDRAAEAEADAREALALAERVGHRGWTATSLRALGIALSAQDRLDEAAVAFARSLKTAEHLSLFTSWAAARLALIHVNCGRLAEAEPLVIAALAQGPPLAHYEARLARVELAAARGADDAPQLAADALARAEAGGHLISVPRLTTLSLHPLETALLR